MTMRNDRLYSDAVTVTTLKPIEVGYSGLYIGVTGDVAIKGIGGVAVTFKAVPAGTILPIGVNRVMATNTTATNILGLIP